MTDTGGAEGNAAAYPMYGLSRCPRCCHIDHADDLFLAGLPHAPGRLVFHARRPVRQPVHY